jgi:hypothetical protein
METAIHSIHNRDIVELKDDSVKINSGQDFLELIGNLPANIIILKKDNLTEAFFDLKTGVAGDILQKVSNYRLRLGIVGDFSGYSSKSLKDFVRESNKAKLVVFVGSVEEALNLFSV